jgi:diaphanous 1
VMFLLNVPSLAYAVARSNNVGIMLARLRLSPQRIKTAILECDEETLSVDDLAMLVRILPSVDEAERLRTFEGEITKLAKADSFLREISTIPRIKDRLEAMVFKSRFELQVAELVPDLTILRSAMIQVKGSERFKDVLGMILRLGNRLNGGTFRGNATGFKLGDLLKVSDYG